VNGIKAIETEYAGCLFRSRSEARWAVFFDRMGVEWEHEPEGFETSAGKYLPDFRISIPQIKNYGYHQWFEVKPPNSPIDARHAALAAESHTPLIVARGMPRSYADQMRTWESPLMAYGIEPRTWPVAFCDSADPWGDESYCSLGSQRHWCQENMAHTLMGTAKCHLALYGAHEGSEYGAGYKTYAPFEGRHIDAAYRAARSERFGT